MSDIHIDHEAAKRKSEFCISYPALFKKQEANICRAYLDMVAQRDAERERVAAMQGLIGSPDYPHGFEALSDDAVRQADALLARLEESK